MFVVSLSEERKFFFWIKIIIIGGNLIDSVRKWKEVAWEIEVKIIKRNRVNDGIGEEIVRNKIEEWGKISKIEGEINVEGGGILKKTSIIGLWTIT